MQVGTLWKAKEVWLDTFYTKSVGQTFSWSIWEMLWELKMLRAPECTLNHKKYITERYNSWTKWEYCSRFLLRGASLNLSCFFHIFKSFSLNMCWVFFAATEWKGPTAGLKPGSPQNLLPSQLAWSAMCRCVGVRIRICEGTLMPLHSFGGLLKDFGKSWLSIRGQWAWLWGVVEQVIKQRWVVVRHMLSMTLADLGVIASAGSRGRKVGGEKVYLEDRVTARWVPAYCIQVDATVVEHELMLWSFYFPLQ